MGKIPHASGAAARSGADLDSALGLRPTDVIGAFFLAGLGFMLAGAIAAAAGSALGWEWTRWLALHLVLLGGVSQLVIGASQFFAGAFLATDPPPRALVRFQLGAWNGGVVVLAAAVPAGAEPLADLGVALLLSGLAGHWLGLRRIRRRSLQRRPFATRWYAAGAGFLAVGIVAGALLVRGEVWSHGDLLAAHVSLNLAGWLGTAIVGTLHTFYPSLARTRLAYPRLERWTFALWVGGVAALALGYGLALAAVAVAGWASLALAGLLLGANIARCAAAATRPLSLPARLLGVAQALLVAGLAVALAGALADGTDAIFVGSSRVALAALILAGWVGLTVLGSLLHLLAVVVRVRDLSRPAPAPRPLADAGLTALAAVSVCALALAQGPAPEALAGPATIALAVAYLMLAAKVLRLAGRVALDARPRL